ncbi:unnamed protein product [Rhizoctonia solani]|nr:unnamed protein product [Rhizoctonia solani]
MWFVLRALGCVSSLVPSIMALNVPRPNHAVAELLVVPNNLTIMTPRDTSSLLDRQLLDFGSPFSSGFSGLGHLEARQGCGGTFPTKEVIAVLAESAASLDLSVMVRGVVRRPSLAVTTRDVAIFLRIAVQGEAVARVATGSICSRDLANEPSCIDPDAQTATSITTPQPEPTTTRGHVPPPLSPDSSPRPGASSVGTHVQTTKTAQTPPTGGAGATFTQAKSSTNAGAIVGGTVAGAVALALLVAVFIIWRRKQSNGAADSEIPVNGTVSDPSSSHAYSPNVPPTPGTVDPFLTPMTQHPNPGVSYFATPLDKPTSDTGSSPQYTGLPEPQHGDDTGVAIGAPTIPVPRHDIHHPHPHSMSVTPLGKSTADSGPARAWSDFISNPSMPSGQNATDGDNNTPIPSGLLNPERMNTSSAYLGTPSAGNAYGATSPLRAPLPVHQPPEGGEHSANRDLYPSPASLQHESLYPGAFAENSGGLRIPSGAAPP